MSVDADRSSGLVRRSTWNFWRFFYGLPRPATTAFRRRGAPWRQERRRAFLLLLAPLLLAACGFQFQGPLEFPALSGGIWLQSAHGTTPLRRALNEQLRLAEVTVHGEPGEDVAVLRLLDDESEVSLVAISANNLPTVTEISYRVRYTLRLGSARLIDDREREVNHTRVQDEFRVLGMERETEVLRDALAEELAWQILRDLASLPVPAAAAP